MFDTRMYVALFSWDIVEMFKRQVILVLNTTCVKKCSLKGHADKICRVTTPWELR